MGFSLSPALKSALEEGALVFLSTEAGGFGLQAAGVSDGYSFPTGAFTVAAFIAGVIAAVRDYQTSDAPAAPASG
jgi:hypothetical protein